MTTRYVPILRSKAGEWAALKMLGAARKSLTPLIEVLPRDFRPTKREQDGKEKYRPLTRFTNKVSDSLPDQPFYLDCGLLEDSFQWPKGTHPLRSLCNKLRANNLQPVPVICPDYGHNLIRTCLSSDNIDPDCAYEYAPNI